MAAAAVAAAAKRRMEKNKNDEDDEPEKTDEELLKEMSEDEVANLLNEKLTKHQDPENWTGLARKYAEFCQPWRRVAVSDSFNAFIIYARPLCVLLFLSLGVAAHGLSRPIGTTAEQCLIFLPPLLFHVMIRSQVIVLAGVLVGLQTYPELDITYDTEAGRVLDKIDLVILIIFIIECFVKIFAEGLAPWRYFCGPEWRWNIFDFTIVVLCLPMWGDTFGGGSVALLRLMRLMRVIKLVKKIPQLQMIVMGLIGGMKSIGYIMLLLFIVFYLFAVAGMYAFQKNDPWHYGNLVTAHLTLFRMATLEDWTDVMYINYYGCASELYDSGIYTVDKASAKTGGGVPMFCNSTEAQAKPELTVFYMLFFIIISALVMLSLFVGAVTMSMTDSMAEMKEAQDEADRKRRLLKAKKKAEAARLAEEKKALEERELERRRTALELGEMRDQALGGSPASGRSSPTLKRLSSWASFFPRKSSAGAVSDPGAAPSSPWGRLKKLAVKVGKSSGGSGDGGISREEARERLKMKCVLMKAWDGIDLMSLLDEDDEMGEGLSKHYVHLARKCEKVANSKWFQNTITIVILMAGVMVGAQTYACAGRPSQCSGGEEMFYDRNRAWMDFVDEVILIAFCVEIVVKTIAKEFKPWRYFLTKTNSMDGWNTFDFVVVAGSFIPGSGSMLTMLRLLRLLRVLKLLKAFPELQVIVQALLTGMSSIGYIGVILVMVFYVFANLAIILFRDNDPWHFGTLGMARRRSQRTAEPPTAHCCWPFLPFATTPAGFSQSRRCFRDSSFFFFL